MSVEKLTLQSWCQHVGWEAFVRAYVDPTKLSRATQGPPFPASFSAPEWTGRWPPSPGLLSVICILSRERRMLQIRLREKKMLTLSPWLSRAPSTRQSGCILSARSPGGAGSCVSAAQGVVTSALEGASSVLPGRITLSCHGVKEATPATRSLL